ncbi:MAG: thioesterase family protein [Rikenellaceae bacterium]
MIEYTTQLRPRYGEVDQMGFVYHANYVSYFDVARTEMIRSLGITNRKMEEDGVMLPVLSVNINYRTPGHYDELFTIKVMLKEKPRVKIVFDYEVFNENMELITTAQVTLAFMSSEHKKAIRPPKELLALIDNAWK